MRASDSSRRQSTDPPKGLSGRDRTIGRFPPVRSVVFSVRARELSLGLWMMEHGRHILRTGRLLVVGGWKNGRVPLMVVMRVTASQGRVRARVRIVLVMGV